MGGEQALARVALIASADIRDLYDAKGQILDPHLWPDGIYHVHELSRRRLYVSARCETDGCVKFMKFIE